MKVKEMQEEVIKLCKEKGFPLDIATIGKTFFIKRIKEEVYEVENAPDELLKEELTDVLIQTIQALSALDADVEEEFKSKMDINWKREWK